MIDPAAYQDYTAQTAQKKAACKTVFCMRTDDRMAGSVPVWEGRKSALAKVEQDLSAAAASAGGDNALPQSALAYGVHEEITYHAAAQPDSPFGFADLLDMINPLQHIPVVNNIYRHVTGDEIKPAARIVGGAVFGGFLGAAGGLANTILEEETGKDLSGNVLAMVAGQTPRGAEMVAADAGIVREEPEQVLSAALAERDYPVTAVEELPASLLGFTNANPLAVDKTHKLIPLPDARSAGRMMAVGAQAESQSRGPMMLSPRTPITQVSFSSQSLFEDD